MMPRYFKRTGAFFVIENVRQRMHAEPALSLPAAGHEQGRPPILWYEAQHFHDLYDGHS